MAGSLKVVCYPEVISIGAGAGIERVITYVLARRYNDSPNPASGHLECFSMYLREIVQIASESLKGVACMTWARSSPVALNRAPAASVAARGVPWQLERRPRVWVNNTGFWHGDGPWGAPWVHGGSLKGAACTAQARSSPVALI